MQQFRQTSHLSFPLQLLEVVVRVKLFLLLLVGQHPRDLKVDPGYLVLVVVMVVMVRGCRGRVVMVMSRQCRLVLEAGSHSIRVLVPGGRSGGEHASERVHGGHH